MATDIVMPRLSDSMEEGTILKWMKSVGDEVAVGDELVEIETDKANMVYESDTAGTLIEIVAERGRHAADRRGDRAGRRGGRGAERRRQGTRQTEAAASNRAEQQHRETRPLPEAKPSEAAGSWLPSEPPRPSRRRTGSSEADGRARQGLTPRPADRQEKGSTSARSQGSGPGGRIVKADVERAAESGARRGSARRRPVGGAAAGAGRPCPRSPETAKGETTTPGADQAAADGRAADGRVEGDRAALLPQRRDRHEPRVEARARIKAAAGEGEVVPSFNDMVVKACALALREFPRANGAYRDGRFELYSRVNVGVAVAGQDALVVPTVFDADRKGLRQIAGEARALAARVREGQITPPELSGGTFTVSNLGMFGIDSFSAVINPPQAGILAVGAITEQAGRPRRRDRHGAPDVGDARLRPPHPLRRRRRRVPGPDPGAARRAGLPGALAGSGCTVQSRVCGRLCPG